MQNAIPDSGMPMEMLSIEQFAAKMGVKRTTIYDWLKSGHLRSGRHYIRIGGTVRFPWGVELLQKLFEDSIEPTQPETHKDKEALIKPLPRIVATGKRQLQVNLDY
ncbi:helix-turn-helix domain-containing protein [Geobacter sulfurreducens]|uniref:helix-turn-helix domain-containing protein n=1 Tax=Geobacter sulfurreducens TaxID=35554 RepID=UPI000DBB2EC1|nr:helix-turn-helix domain-containing protein [Geobacter sulfurreducens]BBA70633.1 hypothetical protein YM18_2114 [Geobacter sulfurreducens]